MATIIEELRDMMGDTITCTPGAEDMTGDFVPSGEVLALDCHLSGRTRLVRDATGREVTSSIQALIAGAYDLTVEAHRYTLPARFSPREDLRAITIKRATDEDGAHHETVMLP